jgi:hypothetical protein
LRKASFPSSTEVNVGCALEHSALNRYTTSLSKLDPIHDIIHTK